MAQGLTLLDVFPKGVDEAVEKLDAASDTVLAKRRQQNGTDYPEAKVRVKGEEWCSEAVYIAVRASSSLHADPRTPHTSQCQRYFGDVCYESPRPLASCKGFLSPSHMPPYCKFPTYLCSQWPCVSRQVRVAGFNWKKVTVEPSNEEHVDLREVLKTGSYIVDGILNQTWYRDKDACINGETKQVKGKVVPKAMNRGRQRMRRRGATRSLSRTVSCTSGPAMVSTSLASSGSGWAITA